MRLTIVEAGNVVCAFHPCRTECECHYARMRIFVRRTAVTPIDHRYRPGSELASGENQNREREATKFTEIIHRIVGFRGPGVFRVHRASLDT